jgi:predicted DCC family thiol-disulfide oxidoreductase YuxK
MPAALFPMAVFYDASCPLCTKEMAHIKALDSAEHIMLVDCSPANFSHPDITAAGIAQRDLMRLIHARGANGQWLIGVDVFIALYQQIGLPKVAGMWAHPWLGRALRAIYPWLARYRQQLSRLGADRLYFWFVERESRAAIARRCSDSSCAL